MITATDGLTPSQSVSCPRWSPPKKPRELADRTNGVGGAAATRLCMSVRSTNELLQPRRARARSLAHPSIWVGPRPRATRPPRLLFLFPSHRFHCFPTARQSMPACLPAFLPAARSGMAYGRGRLLSCPSRHSRPTARPSEDTITIVSSIQPRGYEVYLQGW